MRVLLACVYMYHMGAWYPQRPEEDIRFPGIRVTNGHHMGPRNRTLKSSQEQWVLLIGEPSLQPHFSFL